jgi:hypothetical protein
VGGKGLLQMLEFFDQLFPRVSKFLTGSFILWMVGMQMHHNSLHLIEELDITLLSFGGAYLEEDNMLITKRFSIIVMHFLETILRGLLGFLRKGFKF